MISIIFLSIGIFLGLGLCIYPLIICKNDGFNILNCFPFEGSKTIVERYIVCGLSIFFSIFSVIGIVSSLSSVNYVSMISADIFYTISCIGLIGMFFFRFDNYKSHLITTIMFFLGIIGGNISLFACYIIASMSNIPFEINNVICYILLVIGIIQIGGILFSQLNKWMYLEKAEENGKVVYIRPKRNSLAILEWSNIFILIGVEVLFLLNSILLFTTNL